MNIKYGFLHRQGNFLNTELKRTATNSKRSEFVSSSSQFGAFYDMFGGTLILD